jgi:hypothetical protein
VTSEQSWRRNRNFGICGRIPCQCLVNEFRRNERGRTSYTRDRLGQLPRIEEVDLLVTEIGLPPLQTLTAATTTRPEAFSPTLDAGGISGLRRRPRRETADLWSTVVQFGGMPVRFQERPIDRCSGNGGAARI